MKVEADTSVSAEDRLVSLTKINIVESNFPGLGKEDVQDIVKTVDSTIPDDGKIIALDRVLANIDKSAIIPKNVDGIKADPPAIFFSKTPAVLVNVDGQPIWSTIEGNDLKFAVNTNWDLFQHEPTKTLYLLVGDSFLKAMDLGGPWTYAGDLPDSFKKLPADDNWKDVTDALPGKKLSPEKTPKVFTSTAPAELILLTGEPKYVPVTSASPLQWVSNPESDIFRMGPTGPVYYLVAGRWFTSAGFNGPWTFATPNLPEPFKKIPLEHDRSRVPITRNGQNGSSFATKTGSGDVYAGHDGNVYKKNGDSWQKYDNGGWNNVQQPTQAQRDQAKSNVQNRAGNSATTRSTPPRVDSSTYGQLNRDSSARSAGSTRTGAYQGVRSSGTGGGSYRPAPRGGGGRIRR